MLTDTRTFWMAIFLLAILVLCCTHRVKLPARQSHTFVNLLPLHLTLLIPIQLKGGYQQNWQIYFFCLAVIIILVIVFIKLRAGYIRLQNEKIDRLVQERTKEISRAASQKNKNSPTEKTSSKSKISEPAFRKEHSKEEQEWLAQFEALAEANISDPNFKAKELAVALNLSRTQCYRKLKALTDLTPGAWLQEARLQKAHRLLEEKSCDSVKAVAYEVGINPNYFSEAYKKRFNRLPSEYF